jgi:hypothetical protein
MLPHTSAAAASAAGLVVILGSFWFCLCQVFIIFFGIGFFCIATIHNFTSVPVKWRC